MDWNETSHRRQFLHLAASVAALPALPHSARAQPYPSRAIRWIVPFAVGSSATTLLLEGASRPYAMFKDYWKYEWVLPVYHYEGIEPLLATIAERVIAPAEGTVKALEKKRRRIEAELIKPQ